MATETHLDIPNCNRLDTITRGTEVGNACWIEDRFTIIYSWRTWNRNWTGRGEAVLWYYTSGITTLIGVYYIILTQFEIVPTGSRFDNVNTSSALTFQTHEQIHSFSLSSKYARQTLRDTWHNRLSHSLTTNKMTGKSLLMLSVYIDCLYCWLNNQHVVIIINSKPT